MLTAQNTVHTNLLPYKIFRYGWVTAVILIGDIRQTLNYEPSIIPFIP